MNSVLRNERDERRELPAEASRVYSGERGQVGMLPWRSKLREVIRPGSVLVYARMIRLPSKLVVKGWPFGRWSILGGVNGRRFEGELRSRGWQFRRWKKLARWGWGVSPHGALAHALRKLVGSAEDEYRNTLEIKNLRVWRILSFHVVRISAEPATVYWSREHVSNRQAA